MNLLPVSDPAPVMQKSTILVRYDSNKYKEPGGAHKILRQTPDASTRSSIHSLESRSLSNSNRKLTESNIATIPEPAVCKVSSWLNNNPISRHKLFVRNLPFTNEHLYSIKKLKYQQNEYKHSGIFERYDFNKSEETRLNSGQVIHSKVIENRDSDSQSTNDDPKKKIVLLDPPLSPESQKKNELCSYLKLMDLKHKKHKNGKIFTNRRSTRVKNLLILSEKKELERKLSFETKDEPAEIETDQTAQVKNEIKLFNGMFSPSVIPKTMLTKQVDFDKTMLKIYNLPLRRKPLFNRADKENNHRKVRQRVELKKQITRKQKLIKPQKPMNLKKKTVRNFEPVRLAGRILRSTNYKRRRSAFMTRYQLAKQRLLQKKYSQKKVALKQPKVVKEKLKHITKTDKTEPTLVEHSYTKTDTQITNNTENFIKQLTPEHRKVLQDSPCYHKIINNTPSHSSSSKLTPLDNTSDTDCAIIKPQHDTKSDDDSSDFLGFNGFHTPQKCRQNIIQIQQDIILKPSLNFISPLKLTPEKPVNVMKVTPPENVDNVMKLTLPENPDNVIEPVQNKLINNQFNNLFEHDTQTTSSSVLSDKIDVIPVSKKAVKSLHRNLVQNKRRSIIRVSTDLNKSDLDMKNSWSPNKLDKKPSHLIRIDQDNGNILNAYYFDYNLVVIQEQSVSFWTQSALGFMLEAQNMWIPRGSIQRLGLDNGCVHRHSNESMVSTDSTFAYVELWTKEHKSDYRERPVADIFAVIYFWQSRQLGLDKKVLQIENINGFADDVRYVVTKNSGNILVSWRTVKDDTTTSFIHCYQLASDYQMIVSIKELESVDHTILSLHNIEDSDTLVMGYGENKVTIWNLEFGYIVATIDIVDKSPEAIHLWVKCDRGFLFSLQQFPDGVLRLIAINGINHSWKKLQMYKPPSGFHRLQGVCVENGILVCFYNNGLLCWNIQTGDLMAEELSSEVKYIPSGKHVICVTSNQQIKVKNALSYLITNYDFSEI